MGAKKSFGILAVAVILCVFALAQTVVAQCTTNSCPVQRETNWSGIEPVARLATIADAGVARSVSVIGNVHQRAAGFVASPLATTRARAAQLASIGTVAHLHALPPRVSHEGIGYGHSRRSAIGNACHSGKILRKVRVVRSGNGFVAVIHSR